MPLRRRESAIEYPPEAYKRKKKPQTPVQSRDAACHLLQEHGDDHQQC